MLYAKQDRIFTALDSATYSNLRLVRAFKVLRILKRLVELRMLVNALTASLWPLVNAFVVVVIFVNIYAVLGVSFFKDSDPDFFGTFSKAIFTIIQISTLDNWSLVARSEPYRDDDGNMSNTSSFFFVSLVFVISFTLLPVVVAVLLDNFTQATRKEKDKIRMEARERSERVDGTSKFSCSLDPIICRLVAGVCPCRPAPVCAWI
jgi:voltage-gated sodium channel